MISRIAQKCLVAAVALALPCVAQAAWLTGYQGTVSFGTQPDGVVRFAVFDNTTFGGTDPYTQLDANGVVGPANLTSNYIYVYQLLNTGSDTGLREVLSFFNIDLNSDFVLAAGFFGGTGFNGDPVANGADPTFVFGDTSLVDPTRYFDYSGTPSANSGTFQFGNSVNPGQNSSLLVVIGQGPPTWSTQNNVDANNASSALFRLPVPTPEPGTCIMLGLGLFAGAGAYMRRRNTTPVAAV